MRVMWLHAMMDNAIMQYSDACHVVPCHDGPRNHAVAMCVMWSYAMMNHAIMLYDVWHIVPCHDGQCHHAV